MKSIIGFMGTKGHGKDTCASFLIKERGYLQASFAKALYEEVACAFGVTVEFLQNRTTKETPLSELALEKCIDVSFVECFLEDTRQTGPDAISAQRSPREILQIWGTEYRRHRGIDSYWVDIVGRLIAQNPEGKYVITDVRYPNEHTYLREMGAKLVRVRRPDLEAQEALLADATAMHSSETAAKSLSADAVFVNEVGFLERLREDVLAFEATVGI